MSWKPIKGMESLGPPEMARRMRQADEVIGVKPRAKLPDDRVLGPAVQTAATEDLAVERIATLELRVDRLEDVLAVLTAMVKDGVNPVAGKTGKTTEKLVSPAPDEGEADRRKRWREANREKIRVRDRARKAKQRAEAGR